MDIWRREDYICCNKYRQAGCGFKYLDNGVLGVKFKVQYCKNDKQKRIIYENHIYYIYVLNGVLNDN